jgi:hypothetical protein
MNLCGKAESFFQNFVGITALQVFHLLNHHNYYRSFLTCNAATGRYNT